MNRLHFVQPLLFSLILITGLTGLFDKKGIALPLHQNRISQPLTHSFHLVSQASAQSAIRFIPSTARSAPTTGRRRGGASRGNCSPSNQPLTALVPSPVDHNSTSHSGEDAAMLSLTSMARPTFWFYVPAPLSPNESAEFLLLDENEDYMYRTTVDNTQTSGVINVALPSTISLEADKTYRWVFQIDCGTDNLVYVWGDVKRITLARNLHTQLDRASERDRAALYAANGIWYEAITTLAALRLATPTDPTIRADWASLLQSADLDAVANAPLLPCCGTE